MKLSKLQADLGYNEFYPITDFTVSYDIKAHNIGTVSKTFTVDSHIIAKKVNGVLFYTAVYKKENKYFNTNLELDSSKFKVYVPKYTKFSKNNDDARIIIISLVLFISLLMFHDKKG